MSSQRIAKAGVPWALSAPTSGRGYPDKENVGVEVVGTPGNEHNIQSHDREGVVDFVKWFLVATTAYFNRLLRARLGLHTAYLVRGSVIILALGSTAPSPRHWQRVDPVLSDASIGRTQKEMICLPRALAPSASQSTGRESRRLS